MKIVLLTALITFQLWLAFFMYGTFYYAYMPPELHTKAVYLDFSTCDRFDGSEACPFPHTNVSLVKDAGRQRLFMPGQKYQVRLDMEMPESPVNENLGVFMVKLKAFSKSDEITTKSSRPAMIRYRSPLLKMMDVVFLAPLFITGYSEEKQMVQVDLMNDFIDNAYKPTVKVNVEVRARQLEIYTAVLKIHAQFTGLRYLMFYWPLLSAVVSVFFNFCFLTVLSMMMWQQCVGYLLNEPSLEEREMRDISPVMTYEERRRLARQNMGQERSNLFRRSPPHVTIIDPVEQQSQRASITPTTSSQPGTSQPSGAQRPSSPSKSPQRTVRRRTSRTREGGTHPTEGAAPEGPSSGISSDNGEPNQKDEQREVETLKGEDSISGSSQSWTSTSTDDPPSGSEKVEERKDVEQEGAERRNDDDRDVDVSEGASGSRRGSAGTTGILRHRSFPTS